jgi:ribosomal protein S7
VLRGLEASKLLRAAFHRQAIWLLTTGAREAAFRNVKTIAECLADELINAAKGSSNRCARARAAPP